MEKNSLTGLEIAVIGMSGRFPGAKDLHQFWDNLKNGIESMSFFSTQELEEAGIQLELLKSTNYVKAKGILEDIEYFDASFFGYTAREAEMMDPQVRLLHEVAWEALEDAGYDPQQYNRLIGLYAGAAHNHLWEGLAAFSGKSGDIGYWTAYQLVDKDYLSMRISYALHLIGPSYTLYTACSTSLVAVHMACQAILNGECDMALAGGVTILLPNKSGYIYKEGMVQSPDGRCKAFDAAANGISVGSGAGIVLLKRLEEAIEDRDFIYAVIRGSATNNDGPRKSGFTAPSVEGQVEAISIAHQMAHAEPESITYVETHGTGTPVGDPIEMEALTLAFDTPKRNYCAIGTVKTNIGHLDAAAGIAGLIKTILALTHRAIPPSINFKTPNPEIDFEHSPFYVNKELKEWKSNIFPLRAGVSSFGIGGTNVHVVLEEATVTREKRTGDSKEEVNQTGGRDYQLIVLSAKTQSALEKISQNLAEYLKNNPDTPLADVAYTLQVGRKASNSRRMILGADREEVIKALPPPGEGKNRSYLLTDENIPVVFMFPGQGAQYVNMGLDLYKKEPVFREEMNNCFEILTPVMGYDIKEILYPPGTDKRDLHLSTDINQTEIAQPVLFIFEYALAALLMKWGIEPYAMIGHSIGEYVAACLSGVFSLEDAISLVAVRGKLMQQMPTGAMISVFLPEDELEPLLNGIEELSLAAVNAPSICVVSGPHDAIAALENQLKTEGHDFSRLHTSHAFHSWMMDPMLKKFEDEVGRVLLNKPEIPYISNVTGNWAAVEEVSDPRYWSAQVQRPVRFADGITKLLEQENALFVEVGPGQTLSTFVRKHKNKETRQPVINLVRHPKEEISDTCFLGDKIGRLWLYGVNIRWQGYYNGEKRYRIPLPTYPFEGRPYWIESNTLTTDVGTAPEKSSTGKRPDIADWFYIPSWKRTEIFGNKTGESPAPCNWLFFCDDCGLGVQLAKGFETYPQNHIIIVKTGPGFARCGEREYTVNPGKESDYDALIDHLRSLQRLPQRVVHLWNVDGKKNRDLDKIGKKGVEQPVQDTGFYSLVYFAQAMSKQELTHEVRLTVLTNKMQEVTGEEVLCPQKATVLGPVRVIPREYPNIFCCSVDIVLPEPGSKKEKKLLEQLTGELTSNTGDIIIAFRNNYRLVQTYEPVRLEVPTGQIPRLREQGVYFITGGLGGIGLVLAGHLAKTVHAKLILVGRSDFPARDEWNQWLNTHQQQDRISRKIAKLRELEELGAEILVLKGDVGDYQQMEQVVAQATKRFGKIHGVIHSAGIPGGGIIQLKKPAAAEQVMAPKVIGTLVLDHVLKEQPLDFFLLCSSVNSILSIFGQVDYSAANAFLDAFAFHKTASDDIFTVSINWDTWQEVGMAVDAVSNDTAHPLLDRYIPGEPNRETYITRFKLSSHWVLKEHMIMGNIGLVPGVTYLEMVRAAFEKNAGNRTVEIRDVYFLNPMMVEEDEERDAALILEKQDNGYDFRIDSRMTPGEEGWQNHVMGKITVVEQGNKETRKHEIKAIELTFNQEEENITENQNTPVAGPIIFGPRWKNVKKVHYGKKRGLALLELPEPYRSDLEYYKLHPALLDAAAAFLKHYVHKKGNYIPFSYKKLRINGPLPARIYSYSRLVENPDSQNEFLKFDITIMDEQGKELVDIKEFTMMEVSHQVEGRIKGKMVTANADIPGKTGTMETDLLKNGIRPVEGIDVFNRILGNSLPQVVVSTIDLQARIRNSNLSKDRLMELELTKHHVDSARDPRPELRSEFAAPRTDIERMIAGAWQEVLGLQEVGINDDFFELGGDSVSIIRLNARLKKILERDISEVAMFRHLTISSFIQYLDREETAEGVAGELKDRSSEYEKSKNRLKHRLHRK